MAQIFCTVYDNKGRPVAAKTLVDAAGNDVINPRTGRPLIVPRDYDVNAAIAFGRSLNNLPRLPFNEELAAREMAKTYEAMVNAFWHGGPQDLQRSYNRMVGGGGDEFVKDFEDAASFNLGVVGRAAGLSPSEIALGGGLFNLRNRITNPNIDTSGPFFNNPNNARSIDEGIKAHDSGRFFGPTPDKRDGADQVSPDAYQKARPNAPDDWIGPAQGSEDQGQPQNPGRSGAVDPQQPNRQLASWQPGGLPPVNSTAAPGLPQHVIDTGNYLRANGFEITPRSMYVASVLGPQRAVDLFKRTGSTSSDEVPPADAATGDQMRAWVRQLRLGPAAAVSPSPTPDFGASNAPAPGAQPVWSNMGAASQGDTSGDAGVPAYGSG